MLFFFFFFNDTATNEIYTLSLHDALPICNYFQQGSISTTAACTDELECIEHSLTNYALLDCCMCMRVIYAYLLSGMLE